MKKIFTFVSSVVLFTTVSSAIAANLTCPSINEIRSKAKLQRAAQVGDDKTYAWGVTSNVFGSGEAGWNVLMFLTIPEVGNPWDAVQYSQLYLDNSVLVTPTIISSDANHMTCMYTGEDFKYAVYAETPANYGVARAKAAAKF